MDFSEDLALTIEGYHGVLSCRAAEQRLLAKAEPGYFLLRRPDDLRFEYVLSYLDKSNNVKHIVLPTDPRHNLLGKNPQLVNLLDVLGFIIDKFNSEGNQLLFQLNSDDNVPVPEQFLDALSCHVCTETFGSDKQLKYHKDIHKIHFCHLCEIVISKNNVTSHNRSCRNKEVQENFPCDKCNFTTHHRKSLERHLQAHQNGKYSHVCHLCKEGCNTERLLVIHKFKKHSLGVPCQHCDKMFESSDKRDTHVKKFHKPKKVHSCPECQKQFRVPAELRRHMETHQKTRTDHPPPLHSCEDCSYKSGDKSNFMRHCRTFHQPRKPVVISSLHCWQIMSQGLMSLRGGIQMYKALKSILGPEHFERNLESTLKSCLNSFSEDFESIKITWRDSKNKKIKSTLVFAKDLETIVARIIQEKKMTNPRVIFR